jgi:hypothetical protein
MRDAAHEVRFAGYEAAHGDLVSEQITIEDAEEIVVLMDAIQERVYQDPAQLARSPRSKTRWNPSAAWPCRTEL